MGTQYQQLSLEDRCAIANLHAESLGPDFRQDDGLLLPDNCFKDYLGLTSVLR